MNEILPSLNDCRFCGKLKCKFFVNYNMCKRDKCLNCHRFNKSKDISINSGDDFVLKNFLLDYFKVSDLTNYFSKMDISQIVKEKDLIGIIKFDHDKGELPPPKEEKKRIFYFKSKKYRHYCKLI